MEKEIWKPWPTNPRYMISSYGQVKGLNGRIMKLKENKGYMYVNLRPQKMRPDYVPSIGWLRKLF